MNKALAAVKATPGTINITQKIFRKRFGKHKSFERPGFWKDNFTRRAAFAWQGSRGLANSSEYLASRKSRVKIPGGLLIISQANLGDNDPFQRPYNILSADFSFAATWLILSLR